MIETTLGDSGAYIFRSDESQNEILFVDDGSSVALSCLDEVGLALRPAAALPLAKGCLVAPGDHVLSEDDRSLLSPFLFDEWQPVAFLVGDADQVSQALLLFKEAPEIGLAVSLAKKEATAFLLDGCLVALEDGRSVPASSLLRQDASEAEETSRAFVPISKGKPVNLDADVAYEEPIAKADDDEPLNISVSRASFAGSSNKKPANLDDPKPRRAADDDEAPTAAIVKKSAFSGLSNRKPANLNETPAAKKPAIQIVPKETPIPSFGGLSNRKPVNLDASDPEKPAPKHHRLGVVVRSPFESNHKKD